jgi:hypothetical protein
MIPIVTGSLAGVAAPEDGDVPDGVPVADGTTDPEGSAPPDGAGESFAEFTAMPTPTPMKTAAHVTNTPAATQRRETDCRFGGGSFGVPDIRQPYCRRSGHPRRAAHVFALVGLSTPHHGGRDLARVAVHPFARKSSD